jgi:predicted CXXCH cytochrome family protein
LLRAEGNALCLECHGPETVPQEDKEAGVFKIFGGKVELPDDYYTKNKVPVLPIRYGKGHPIEGHPVADVLNPADITKVLAKINCQSCHQPHASANPDLLVNDHKNNTEFCASCHKDLTKR